MLEKIRERTLVLVAASTCLSKSELIALKWGNIDFTQGAMNVARSIPYGNSSKAGAVAASVCTGDAGRIHRPRCRISGKLS